MYRYLFVVASFVIWIWALVDCIRVPEDSMYREGNKLIWVIVIIFTYFIGALLYLVLGKPRRERRTY